MIGVDYGSKWVVAQAVEANDSATLAQFVFEKIIMPFGVLKNLTSDRGSNFMSDMFGELSAVMGIAHVPVVAYHNMGNGLAEKRVGEFKKAISKYINDEQTDWDVYLPAICFAFNTKPVKRIGGFTPAKLMYGEDLRLPQDNFIPKYDGDEDFPIPAHLFIQHLQLTLSDALDQVRAEETQQRLKDKIRYDANAREVEYAIGDQVMVRAMARTKGKHKAFEGLWRTGYEVKAKLSSIHYRVQCNKRGAVKLDVVHVSQMRPYNMRKPDEPELTDMEDMSASHKPLKPVEKELEDEIEEFPVRPELPEPEVEDVPVVPVRTRYGRKVKQPDRLINKQ
ncbi:uncharacterized protein LOC129591410 [Paramacrobiotus metropolitanus]|uniref:uncharacterized protein LOC129591410 n=1 Tax=Paramacrobiotus metropolitanus TaxID=2943436 RepID=UPI002445B9AE|nr:uncharacterized protein LOC129591410 [Paramacrobiotus metropolitanus]